MATSTNVKNRRIVVAATEGKPKHSITVPFEWIKIQDLLDNYQPGDGANFPDVLDYKRQDDSYRMLLDQIPSKGIQWPLLGRRYETSKVADGMVEPLSHPSEGYLSNGHHRLAALLDLGYEYAPITFSGVWSDSTDDW